MASLPFTLRRPWLILSHWRTDRDRPDLDKLRGITDPERFVWAILPHAARTFAACIALLPSAKARAAAVGYLYCRCLDTYEDLSPDPRPLLAQFVEHVENGTPAPQLVDPHVQDVRDRSHLLLVECIDRVDAVYASLSEVHKRSVVRCVRDMAAGMQRGKEQILPYCRTVLGNPVVFGMELLLDRGLDERETETAMRVGEMVQLANITRDIEKDHERGVVYDPRLKECTSEETVRAVREDLLQLALERAPDYRRMIWMLRKPRLHLGRASALLMLLFTSRYYDRCAVRLGHEGWNETRSTLGLMLRTFPASFSHGYALRVARAIELKMKD
ncbi:MAG: squalene/phytoene synthase family protein [Planctomycetota bacterium]|jgi:phytoene/squalene synthetase